MRRLLILTLLLPALSMGQEVWTPQRVLETAFSHRSIILSAKLKLEQARSGLRSLGAYPTTRIEFGKGTEPDVSGGEDLLIAQPIDLFGKTRANRSVGQAAVLSAVAGLRQTQLDIQGEVLAAYADYYSANLLLDSSRTNLEIAGKVFDATKKRVDQGDLAPTQLLRANLDLNRSHQELQIREGTLRVARARFAGALGLPEASLPDRVSDGYEFGGGQFLPDSRPDLLQANADVESAKADGRVAHASQFPDIELQFRRAPFGSPEQYGARIQFVLPLWDWGTATNRRKSARLAELAGRASYMDRKAMSIAEVSVAKAELDSAIESSKFLDQLEKDARQLLQKEQRGFALGASTLLDVLDASRSVREIEESKIDVRTKVLQYSFRLLTVTGTVLTETRK
jgi:outer membrane protein TolC